VGAFIEASIAPDTHMRPLWQTLRYLQDAGFEVLSVEAMREHYAHTAEPWMNTLESRFGEFVALQGEALARVGVVPGRRPARLRGGPMGVDKVLAVKPGR
jgi:cyclopropane-fatty-acyl-phospholipid synthase